MVDCSIPDRKIFFTDPESRSVILNFGSGSRRLVNSRSGSYLEIFVAIGKLLSNNCESLKFIKYWTFSEIFLNLWLSSKELIFLQNSELRIRSQETD
jgi:hypothetical protein